MNKTKICVGQIYSMLTVISQAESKYQPHSVKKKVAQWNCLCQCGQKITVIGSYLLRGRTKNCGCTRDNTTKTDLKPGDRFGRLTLLKYYKGKWETQCDCGNKISRLTNQITSGNIKSCGCLNADQNKKKAAKLIAARKKFDPRTTSARRIWKQYIRRDAECNLSFDQFLQISQRNCFYCGEVPSRVYNFFIAKSNKGSEEAKKKGDFIYNGLDRINSDGYHTLDNVVACCYLCNRNKNTLPQHQFINKIKTMSVKQFFPLQISSLIINNNYLSTSVKCVFYLYKDGDLSLEEFYWLSQQPCYYCGEEKSNKFTYCRKGDRSSPEAREKSILLYNGIDRIDSSKGHTKDNVVPCCKYCNFGKGKLSLNEFNIWIDRVKAFNK
jgi:hypothetical protein